MVCVEGDRGSGRWGFVGTEITRGRRGGVMRGQREGRGGDSGRAREERVGARGEA